MHTHKYNIAYIEELCACVYTYILRGKWDTWIMNTGHNLVKATGSVVLLTSVPTVFLENVLFSVQKLEERSWQAPNAKKLRKEMERLVT